MRVLWDGAVCIEHDGERLYLDPKRQRKTAVVTHAHLDHLVKGAVMTPQTRDIMRARLGAELEAETISIGETMRLGGLELSLHEAGHVLGSAMVQVGDLLYTGDFDTFTGITCGAARPQDCRTLVVEATYGSPDFVLPDQEEVVADMLSWMEDALEKGPVVLGGYEFGKAQDLVALADSIGAPVVVPDSVAKICDVYRKHGVPLRYTPLSKAPRELLSSPHVFVTSRRELRHPVPAHIRNYRDMGAAAAYVSGWSAFWNFCASHDIDAQFPLSNHADFGRLMEFVSACHPESVLTVHGSCEALAKEIRERLKLPAEPLE